MMAANDLVSVVMPCFNHGRFVEEAMRAVLAQTYRHLELLIVDDCSSDDSLAVIQRTAAGDARVRILAHDRNRGASASRNDGLQSAQGDYFAFCDADDVWLPRKLERQVEALESNPGAILAYAESELIDASGLSQSRLFSELYPLPPHPSGRLFLPLCRRNFINTQTVLIRRSALASARPFDERIKWVEDWWLWLLLARQGPFLYEPAPLARYRLHAASTSVQQRPGIARHRYKVLRRNLRSHPDLPATERAFAFYSMGRALAQLRRVRLGRVLMRKGLALTLRHPRGWWQGAKMGGRLLQSLFPVAK